MRGRFDPIHLLFCTIFFGAPAFGLLTMRTRVELRAGIMRRRHPWLPWWKPLALDKRNIVRLVVVDTSYSSAKRGTTVRFDVQAELQNGGLVPVLEALETHADATYIRDALARIADLPAGDSTPQP